MPLRLQEAAAFGQGSDVPEVPNSKTCFLHHQRALFPLSGQHRMTISRETVMKNAAFPACLALQLSAAVCVLMELMAGVH